MVEGIRAVGTGSEAVAVTSRIVDCTVQGQFERTVLSPVKVVTSVPQVTT